MNEYHIDILYKDSRRAVISFEMCHLNWTEQHSLTHIISGGAKLEDDKILAFAS